jgi:signal recognition particle subunit SRP54
MAQMFGGGGPNPLKAMGGGKAPMPSQQEIEDMAAKLGGPGGLKLPGLGGGMPPGFNPFKK